MGGPRDDLAPAVQASNGQGNIAAVSSNRAHITITTDRDYGQIHIMCSALQQHLAIRLAYQSDR
ncbi:MAG: hypothetical protein KJP25_04855 [Gammaproteobacteria bacterium]|nr:hypothetical protein [Gammaproteobacteria bacterium]MBT8150250.1 hypothetical protein [Gammaproteobacteria bacterium]